MKKHKNRELSSILPLFTTAGIFLAVGIILFSVMSKHEKERTPDLTDAVPNGEETTALPTEESEPITEETVGETETMTMTVTESETEPETDPPPVQTIPVSIYTESKNKCKKVEEYSGYFPTSDSDPKWRLDTWTYKDQKNLICDLETFAVFTSNEEQINVTSWDKTWVEKWEDAGLDDSYKIGFEFLIVKKDGNEVRFTVLSPADTFKHEEYFELYLYDCVAHAHDSWYSHITEKTNYPDTKNVMIKITLRNGCYDIDKIELTAFVYDSEDDFDSDGFYRGADRATCVIGRK